MAAAIQAKDTPAAGSEFSPAIHAGPCAIQMAAETQTAKSGHS
jgi:hypothetical protein